MHKNCDVDGLNTELWNVVKANVLYTCDNWCHIKSLFCARGGEVSLASSAWADLAWVGCMYLDLQGNC